MSDKITQNIYSGKYENKVPYVRFGLNKAGWRAYREGEVAMVQLFRDDLEESFGTKNHPLADSLWFKAWEDGHSNGFYDILSHYEELKNWFLTPFDVYINKLKLDNNQ